jgi:hypothetical protein
VAKTGHYLAVNETPAPYVYLPYEQNPRSRMTLVVQSVGDPGELAKPLRDAVRSIDGNVPVFNLRPVATLYESRVTDTWLQLFQMVGTMGFIGLALATAGLYGLIAYTVSRRVKEFGIRVAVGASRRDVVWLVERRGLILAGIGIAIGGLLAAVTAPLLAAGFPDWAHLLRPLYVFVPLVLLMVSAVASYVPAGAPRGWIRCGPCGTNSAGKGDRADRAPGVSMRVNEGGYLCRYSWFTGLSARPDASQASDRQPK